MSVLSRTDILTELQKGRSGIGLIITPMNLKEVGPASVDVTLGNEFIVFKRSSIASTNIKEMPDSRENIYRIQEKKRIGNEENFILHPRQLVLGATREYIVLPDNISAHIVGRSTWGRTGLIIATATYIQPGFKGCMTLELVNDGEIPLVLYPGLCVAQLVLSYTKTEFKGKSGRYQYQTGPIFPNFNKEIEFLNTH